MTKGIDLTNAVAAQLATITTANGYATNIRAVYPFASVKPDSAPLPVILLRVESDEATGERAGRSVQRAATYEVEAVFPRTATLQDLQQCQHDILMALGYGEIPPARDLVPGEVVQEGSEFDPGEGSPTRKLISTLVIHYVEKYF